MPQTAREVIETAFKEGGFFPSPSLVMLIETRLQQAGLLQAPNAEHLLEFLEQLNKARREGGGI